MRRIMLFLAVAAVMATMGLIMVVPAFAQLPPQGAEGYCANAHPQIQGTPETPDEGQRQGFPPVCQFPEEEEPSG
jgi:hypothetical protein